MNRYLLAMVIAVLSMHHLKAQDIIYFFNTNIIEAVVENVADDSISYRMYSDPYGPIYTTDIANVSYIRYENGKTHYFSAQQVTSKPFHQQMIYLRGNLYLDGEKLKVRKLPEQNLPNMYIPDFMTAKSYRSIGISLNISGGLMLAMGALFLIPDFNEKTIAYTYLGCGGLFLGGGITMTVLGNKSLKKIADSYNANSESSSNRTLSLGTCTNGFGLAFNF